MNLQSLTNLNDIVTVGITIQAVIPKITLKVIQIL